MVRLHAGCDSAARAAVLKLDADGHASSLCPIVVEPCGNVLELTLK